MTDVTPPPLSKRMDSRFSYNILRRIDAILLSKPYKFTGRSHFLRCAVYKLLTDEENKKD